MHCHRKALIKLLRGGIVTPSDRKDIPMIKKEAIKNSSNIKLTFVLAADALPAEISKPRVAVVGDFNNWNPAANPLVKRSNGTLSASVALPAGQRIRFRYYGSDGVWFNDQNADAYEVGEYGAENCVALI
jgi:hypothetical protein